MFINISGTKFENVSFRDGENMKIYANTDMKDCVLRDITGNVNAIGVNFQNCTIENIANKQFENCTVDGEPYTD